MGVNTFKNHFRHLNNCVVELSNLKQASYIIPLFQYFLVFATFSEFNCINIENLGPVGPHSPIFSGIGHFFRV